MNTFLMLPTEHNLAYAFGHKQFNKTDSDLNFWRAHFSSPRLMDVRSHKSLGAPQVGYSFLSEHSMLCDNRFKTEAITYTNMMWHNSLDSFRTDDPNFPYAIQIWSVEPKEMSERFLAAAVILSFTDYDLSDPRTGIAVNEMALEFDLPLKPLE